MCYLRNRLSNDMYELNVTDNGQSVVVCNSGIGLSEVTGIDYSTSNVPKHHNSENMKKQMCCMNMDTGMEVTSLHIRTGNCSTLCGCLNGVSEREEALRLCEIFAGPHWRRKMKELEGSYGLQCHRNGEWLFDRLFVMLSLSADRLY